MSHRSAFMAMSIRMLDIDPAVVILLADVGVYGFRDAAKKHPGRILNIGIAEQALVGIAAGMALEGRYPIVHTIATFLARRAYEQMYLDFGAQQLRGLFVGADGYPTLGPTHNCVELQTLVSGIPSMEYVAGGTDHEVGLAVADFVLQRRLGFLRINA